MTDILLIVGSPRPSGVSSRYADELALQLGKPNVRVRQWRMAESSVRGCTGCGVCRHYVTRRSAEKSSAHPRPYCAIRDDMLHLYALLDASDEVHVVSPVYFSGPPGQFKCVLDRFQPYWEMRCGPAALPRNPHEVKRPLTLHVIGAGGDPYGFASLETIVRSAFGAAGFTLLKIVDCIGWGQPDSEQGKMMFQESAEHDGASQQNEQSGRENNSSEPLRQRVSMDDTEGVLDE